MSFRMQRLPYAVKSLADTKSDTDPISTSMLKASADVHVYHCFDVSATVCKMNPDYTLLIFSAN
jgi:hypothetical protein